VAVRIIGGGNWSTLRKPSIRLSPLPAGVGGGGGGVVVITVNKNK
jgi:hypothetical protein